MAHQRVLEALARHGGCATWRVLVGETSARCIRRARDAGVIHRTRRGRYALPTAAEHRRVAHRLTATLSHLSAAIAHGWKVKTQPVLPWVTVPRKRHLIDADRARVHCRWRDLDPAEVAAGITTPLRTVLDCAAALPFDEALAVADSSLRDGDLTHAELIDAARHLRGPGSKQARRVAALADRRAANPFESVLRAIALAFPELKLEPQLRIWDSGLWATVDLGDETLLLVLEAEGFEHHRSRKDLHRDARRYTELTVWGWAVLRFAWEDVMLHPDWVRWAIRAWLERRAGRAVPPAPSRG